MKLELITVIGTLLIGFAAAAKLSSQYLPPHHASTSGGYGGLLQGPKAYAQGPSNQYLAPQASNLHYHGVSGAGHSLRPNFASSFGGAGASGVPGGAGARYGHNSAAAQIPTLRNEYTNDGSGNYRFGYETGNGIRHDETGKFEGGWPHGSPSVMGSYSYTGDDGHVYTVKYTADGSGFHAEGDHLPTPPPIPPEIQESLALHQPGRFNGGAGGAYGGVGGSHGRVGGAYGGVGVSHGGANGAYGGAGGAYGRVGGRGGGGFGGATSYGGGHGGAASSHAPTTSYLPPQQQGYHYGRRH